MYAKVLFPDLDGIFATCTDHVITTPSIEGRGGSRIQAPILYALSCRLVVAFGVFLAFHSWNLWKSTRVVSVRRLVSNYRTVNATFRQDGTRTVQTWVFGCVEYENPAHKVNLNIVCSIFLQHNGAFTSNRRIRGNYIWVKFTPVMFAECCVRVTSVLNSCTPHFINALELFLSIRNT